MGAIAGRMKCLMRVLRPWRANVWARPLQCLTYWRNNEIVSLRGKYVMTKSRRSVHGSRWEGIRQPDPATILDEPLVKLCILVEF
jgi:hypothetical protein